MRVHLRIILALSVASTVVCGGPSDVERTWTARWISVPGASPFEYGVYHFRRAFELPTQPQRFVVHVTADNRYQLFVNGERVVWGPARGDLNHWRYETIDLARWLRSGRNVLAAVVWNYGQFAPEAQQTFRTGFLLQGDTQAERLVDTNAAWKCARNEAYAPLSFTSGDMRGYYVVGPGDRVDGAKHPWGWELPSFDDSSWKAAVVGPGGSSRDARDAPGRWMLVPRAIPLMEERPERRAVVRRATGATVPVNWETEGGAIRISARSSARILLDQTYLTTAFPEAVVSGGRGAEVQLRYAEALYVIGQRQTKGNRNEIEGKEFVGNHDLFIADGGSQRVFRPLWWRTYRYLELVVTTQDEPLTVDDLRGVYTGYPFARKARFDADAPHLQKMLDIGWRTARLCAHETYMDCPYYEQLQYVGDTRI